MGFLLNDEEVGSRYGSLAPDAYRPRIGPLMNPAEVPHPLAHVGSYITDHANLLRNRLLATQLQDGFAPVEAGTPRTGASPLDLINQTRATGSQNLAQLLARFQGGAR
jgi:hypothetical protein